MSKVGGQWFWQLTNLRYAEMQRDGTGGRLLFGVVHEINVT
jgi:hypothetical protein